MNLAELTKFIVSNLVTDPESVSVRVYDDEEYQIIEVIVDNEDMSKDPVICIPENYKEIPDYIKMCIDKEGTIDKLLSPFKQMLGLFDVYMAETKNGVIASRMVCI